MTRQLPVDIPAMGFLGEAPAVAARPRRRTSKHLRRTKLIAAFAMTALVGVGSYAVTYRALVLVSVPAQSPPPSGNHTTPTIPQPTEPAPAPS
jgi:hypothetical protein